ncbi:MAG: S-adenosylmethionine:tRNA ribosyltransferase-isomerase [Bacteroidia bacterium]|nr:S-adenosylmethionine:tRNA ribosyltransferase-isomerase [Bacteroidia bacterium]
MKELKDIRISDYTYELPEERIAKFPLEKRDESKLLLYQQGKIAHHSFKEVVDILTEEHLLVFNDSKVIHARMEFFRKTGARIEILLLNPHEPASVEQAIQAKSHCSWKCIIGRKKRWKEGEILEKKLQIQGKEILIKAELLDRAQDLVQLSFEDADIPFAEILNHSGDLPLPPYLKRDAQASDEEQYQTVYAKESGAVAAPTAGLHFTDQLLSGLQAKGVEQEFVTLHVSAGTFLPVKSDAVVEHDMHREQFVLKHSSLLKIREAVGKIILVGTTSMRVIESLYWMGLQILEGKESIEASHPFHIEKMEAYEKADRDISVKEALDAILFFMETHGHERIYASTSILIMPGYSFKLSRGLITNFHMPDTTLLLLVAALVGEDWREIYQSALDHDYRFLSYGDSSILLP